MATVERKPMGRVPLSAEAVIHSNFTMMYRRHLEYSLPAEVSVKAFYADQPSHSFVFILESDEPVKGWTYDVPIGEHIPLSEAWAQVRESTLTNPVDYVLHNFTIEQFMARVFRDQDNDLLNMDMKLIDFIKEIAPQ
jgi:hypothetical protein